MYGKVPTTRRRAQDYAEIVGEAAVAELRRLASPLSGSRVLHLSTTAFGAGPPEELAAIVPLMNDLGLQAEWQIIRGTAESARLNRAIESELGGSDGRWTPALVETWQRHNALNARLFDASYDFVVVHDPLPAGIPSILSGQPTGAKVGHWLWQCHLDLSAAHPEVWSLLRSYLDCCYDVAIFAADQYVRRDFDVPVVAVVPPAIDALSPRNVELDPATQRRLLARYGVDPDRPIVCQIARFAKRSDPIGIIDVYRQAKQAIPELQLILVSALPAVNSEVWQYFQRVAKHAGDDPDVHLLSNLNEVGNIEQNVFQRAARVVLNRSQRKGFAIAVAEASWKNRPVVADRRGVMPLQVVDGKTGYVVSTSREMAERLVTLLGDSALADQMGRAGHEHVRERFLVTRALGQYLTLFGQVSVRTQQFGGTILGGQEHQYGVPESTQGENKDYSTRPPH